MKLVELIKGPATISTKMKSEIVPIFLIPITHKTSKKRRINNEPTAQKIVKAEIGSISDKTLLIFFRKVSKHSPTSEGIKTMNSTPIIALK